MKMKLFRKKTDNRIKRPVKKTKANAGESLIEMLVSLLIISVSIALLISTVGSSGFLIKKSQEKFDSYYEGSNNLATQTELGAGGKITLKYADLSDAGSEASRAAANTNELSTATTADVGVNYFINDESKKTTVASYKAIITNNDGGSGGSGETPVYGE